MIEEKSLNGMQYLVSYPETFCADKKYPLVIYLHGAGTRGDDIEVLKNNDSFLNIKRHQTLDYVLLAPLCSANNWNEVMSSLISLVDTVRSWEYIDSKRVHLTGNSMGGYGTWELASLRPEWFASIMPVCGGGIKWMSYTLTQLPIRAFHGVCDNVVDPIESLEMVKAVNRFGGRAELILFPKLEHNCWETVYCTQKNYDWLLSFTTDRENVPVEQYSGSYYG